MAKIQKRNYLKRTSVLLSIVFLMIAFAGGIAVASEESEAQSQIEKLREERQYYQRKIEEIEREIRELEEKIRPIYGQFSVTLTEKHKSLDILGEKMVFGFGFPHKLEKGCDILIVILRVKNDANKYIFIKRKLGLWGMRAADVVDDRGNYYGQEGDAIKIEAPETERWVARVKTKAQGWITVSGTSPVTEDIIVPGESYDWLFLFYVPKERTMKSLILGYGIAETPTGFSERREISIPLQKMNVLRG